MLCEFIAEESRRGTLVKTILSSLAQGRLKFTESTTLDALLRRQAKMLRDRTFLFFEGRSMTFGDVDAMVSRVASCLERWGYVAGDGLAIMLDNSPDFIAVYLATQRLGLYAVPINTALVGEGLAHIVRDARVRGIVVEAGFLAALRQADKNQLKKIDVIVRRDPVRDGGRLPGGAKNLEDAFAGVAPRRTWAAPKAEAISTILYTSGTTGLPKGVVYTYGSDWLRKAGLLHRLIHRDDDVLYTCLPLFHANALFLTMSASLWMGLPVVLSRRFSASGFWRDVKRHRATVFNAIGAMIPILLKNPKRPDDRDNSVRLVLSAACPANAWREFERRFGVTIWESYAAVDGGQNFIFNFGNAPVGSLGKLSLSKFRVVDDAGRDAMPFEPGELVFQTGRKDNAVAYFQDEAATREKTRGGCIHTGDIVYRDDKGFLYFVGRKTDSMRRRGENVSACEVENVALQHDAVLECAAYGIASSLGEQDIMCALVAVAGRKIDPRAFVSWMAKRIARHAVPRYVRIVESLPKTPTHRVIKQPLIAAGVTRDTFDAEKRRIGEVA